MILFAKNDGIQPARLLRVKYRTFGSVVLQFEAYLKTRGYFDDNVPESPHS